MVRKKSILKDALREISTTKKRFLSLLLIVTIGVGFYVGLKSTSLDMEKTAKNYYKDTNLMDLKLISSTGFSKADKEKIKSVDGVKGAMLTKTLDTTAKIDDKEYVIKLHGISNDRSKKNDDYINRLVLTGGRYPATINEGLVEESLLKDNNLSVGDLITLKPENTDDLRAKKIKIVGTVRSSYYSSKDRETSSLGNGKTDYYMYIEENNFNIDYYAEAYVTIKNADKLDTYESKYKALINKKKDKISKVAEEITNKKYEENVTFINNNIKLLELSLNELYNSEIPLESLNDSIKEATNQLNEAKKTLSKIKGPSVYVTTRNETPSFYEYKLETERVTNIAKVFPLIFFLVAALVSLTAMTRIVEEERVQLGTLRAMGYSKFDVVFKYVLYAFLASFIGSILGSLLFYKFIPNLVAMCYGMFYEMPKLITTFQANHVFFASLFACVSTVLATILVFIKYTTETPAALMRPTSPKPGKRVFLERINIIWKKLKFSDKVTFRNIFRYKKRLLMTITGICGCTALLLTAFGLRDSVVGIVNKQFSDVNKYDMLVSADVMATNQNVEELKKEINKIKNVKDVTIIKQTSIEISKGNTSESSYLIVPHSKTKLTDFISLQTRNKKKAIKLNDESVVISEKLAKLLKVRENELVNLIIDGKKVSVKVGKITENYVDHYVYMTPALYSSLTGNEVRYNTILVNNKKLSNNEEKKLFKEVSGNDFVSSCTLSSEIKKSYKDNTATLTYVIFILIAAAAALAFVVLYNLSSINISERKRELATVKVLGFYDNEVTNYVHKETVILTILGALAGLVTGSFLTYYVVKVCETNQFMFSFNISIISYVLSFIITLVFLFIVNAFMHFDLKKLNMIEALKSVE